MRLTIFASGSTGNCALLSGGGQRILIDAGISARRICAALLAAGCPPEKLDGVLITHEHADHVSGLATFCKQHPLPVYAPGTVANHLRWSIPGVEVCLREIWPEKAFAVGGMAVTAFPTPHDTPQSVGYRVEADGAVFAFATDTGCVTDMMRAYLTGADTAVIEANHDEDMLRYGPYPAVLKRRILSARGHLSNAECAALAGFLSERGTGNIVLGHLSKQNNTPEKARQTVEAALAGTKTRLYIAPETGRLDVTIEPCFV